MKKLMVIFMAAGMCILTACAASSSEKSSHSGEDSSVLVAYFSAQGHTRSLAEKVAKAIRVSAPKAVFKQGKIMNNYSQEEVAEWIKTID